LLSNINHTLKHRFSRHIDEAVLQTEHLLGITAENSFLIATVGLLPKLPLTGDSIVDFQFLSPVIHRILRVGYLAFLPRATAYRPKQDAQAEHLAEVGEERSQS